MGHSPVLEGVGWGWMLCSTTICGAGGTHLPWYLIFGAGILILADEGILAFNVTLVYGAGSHSEMEALRKCIVNCVYINALRQDGGGQTNIWLLEI